jgi:cation:H+ antiporter
MVDYLVYAQLVAGFALLIFGGDFLVRGALDFGAKRNLSPLIVGATVVAMGTSAPEMVISILSAVSGHPQIALGNVIGSNIANVLLVLGLPVLLHPITTAQVGLKVQSNWMLLVSVAFIGLCFINFLTFSAGLVMLLLLGLFLYFSIKSGVPIQALDQVTQEFSEIPVVQSYWRITGFIGFGMIALPLGADFVVNSGTSLAMQWGVSESVIGLSLVALGTSLPELSATVIAAYYRNSDVVLGNIIGSNLFNILAVLGVTLMVTNIPVAPVFLTLDIWVMLGATVVLWLYAMRGISIGRVSGAFFLASYGVYLWLMYTA